MAKKGSGRLPTSAFVLSTVTVVFGVAHILMRDVYPPGHPVRLVLTGLLVMGFAAFIVAYVRLLSSLDEFQRQMHLFALAIGFPLSLVLVWAIGYFRAEGMLAARDPRDLPIVLLFAYGVGFAASWWRYRAR